MLEATGIKCEGVCGINWFVGTNDFGDCLYGFTPFGAYTIYAYDPQIWVAVSIDDTEMDFESELEAIEAVVRDYKSRVAEMFNKPYDPSERIYGSWGYEEKEDHEVE